MIGKGSTTAILTAEEVQSLLASGLDALPISGKRVLVIIPDGTRTAPIPLMFRLLYEQIGRRAARLDYLIALGTHPPPPTGAVRAARGEARARGGRRPTSPRRGGPG